MEELHGPVNYPNALLFDREEPDGEDIFQFGPKIGDDYERSTFHLDKGEALYGFSAIFESFFRDINLDGGFRDINFEATDFLTNQSELDDDIHYLVQNHPDNPLVQTARTFKQHRHGVLNSISRDLVDEIYNTDMTYAERGYDEAKAPTTDAEQQFRVFKEAGGVPFLDYISEDRQQPISTKQNLERTKQLIEQSAPQIKELMTLQRQLSSQIRQIRDTHTEQMTQNKRRKITDAIFV